ncbi:hypothetical protein CY34DRAFT_485911 [Suillus luteus UH-Slu-Lm8-n1]|uniref:Uncharacterized protein n=1 Tax=Suillus luteus UH-Slu-Lm8-n1 TaxID=930992 RepID=A0A0C9ZHM1_9AGAM|nr:hypothetical protein CY34DRAFT_485911 [Suillus luteus UH-Slu-Lm8-n1]
MGTIWMKESGPTPYALASSWVANYLSICIFLCVDYTSHLNHLTQRGQESKHGQVCWNGHEIAWTWHNK